MRQVFGTSLLALLLAASAAQAQSAPVAFSGYATSSYTWSNNPVGKQIVGRFYDRNHSEYMANALKLVVSKDVDTEKLSGGFKMDALFGQNAEVTGYAGNRLGLGDQGDLLQAYAIVNVPTGKGTYVQFSAGKFATLIGMELLEDVANPNLSLGNQYVYLENFTNTGLKVNAKLSTKLDAQVSISNGWDLVRDNNTGKSVMARIGYAPSAATTLAFIGYTGPEQNASKNKRTGGEVTFSTKLGAKTTAWIEGDIGQEDFDSATTTRRAKWAGAGAWLVRDLSPKTAFVIRGDYVNDKSGSRTSGVLGFPANTGLKFGSVTGTLNIKSIPSVLLRPEIRYDRASSAVFAGEKSQITFAFGSSYIF